MDCSEAVPADPGGAGLPPQPQRRRATLAAVALGGLLVSAGAVGVGGVFDTPCTLMAPSDYLAAKTLIEAQSRGAIDLCLMLQGAALDVCTAKARADERRRRALLEAQYLGTAEAAENARLTKAEALYDVAIAKCDARVGKARLQCLEVARAERDGRLAQARIAS